MDFWTFVDKHFMEIGMILLISIFLGGPLLVAIVVLIVSPFVALAEAIKSGKSERSNQQKTESNGNDQSG